jgi:anti-sigma-K factor RskA
MTDPFRHDDAAYVLGALSAEERAQFEAHLETCPACAARVAEIADLPRRLDGIHPEELADPGPVPDILLPRLVTEIRAARRRRTIVAVTGALAAACIAALIAVVFTGQTSGGTPTPVAAGQPMRQVIATPVHARVALTAEEWGTQITLHCRYDQANGGVFAYKMIAVDRSGERYSLGGWRIKGGQDITYTAGAPVAPKDIAAVIVTTPNNVPILRLRT